MEKIIITLMGPVSFIVFLLAFFYVRILIFQLSFKIDDLLELANNQNGRIEAANLLVDLLMRKLKILEKRVEFLSRD